MVPQHFSKSTKTLIGIGLLVPILLIATPAVLAHRSEAEVKKSFRWVTHTLEVEGAVGALLNSLLDAETGQRGSLLTQRAVYLEPYDAARERVGHQITDLRNLTRDNASQQQRLDEATPLVRERLNILAETIDHERRGEHDVALSLVNSDRGKALMDKARGVLRLMADEEHRLLWLRQRDLTQHTGRRTRLLLVLFAGSALSAAVVLDLLRRISKLEPVATLCANSRTVEYDGEWISFQEYLKQRFNVATIEGLSPEEFEKARADGQRH
ncbi:MAG: CHASE3 domain-containing protein [Verrucomicrobiota bacterium]|nr:CHASE3 domain-containing protein [Verrucomicrobiota bacterium]